MVKTVNSILYSLTLSIPPPITHLLPSVLPSLPPSLPPSFHPYPPSPPSIQMRQLGTTPSGSLQKAPSISRQSARERISTGAGAAEGASGGAGPGPGTEGDNISLASNVTMGEIDTALQEAYYNVGMVSVGRACVWVYMCVGQVLPSLYCPLPLFIPSLLPLFLLPIVHSPLL